MSLRAEPARLLSLSRSGIAELLLLPLLFCVCVARLWLMPLPSSFWVDEMVTAFVVQHPGHPSLAVAPQVPASIYYWLPRISQHLFGLSEVAYRVPSVLAMAAAMFLIFRLAMRLVHPRAGWFAVFACLALSGINYEAADARPYSLGILAAAATVYYLVKWLDSARDIHALLFVLCGALLWRVQLIYWPFFAVLAGYAIWRLAAAETPVTWLRAAAVFALLGLALVPVALSALEIFHNAKAHVIAEIPTFRAFEHALRWNVIAICGGAAWLLSLYFRSPPERVPAPSSIALIVGWWLCQPVSLFVWSHLTGNSVFISRYLSLALPGTALAAAAAAAPFMPAPNWKPLSAVFALAVLVLMGQWDTAWPAHGVSNWRSAASFVNGSEADAQTPVICPSPFIEARPPAWRPDYPLPGFLYAHLPVYPVTGRIYLFPFATSPEAERYAGGLTRDTLAPATRFLIYGGAGNVRFWREWFSARTELAAWRSQLHRFGDVYVVVFGRDAAVVESRLSQPGR